MQRRIVYLGSVLLCAICLSTLPARADMQQMISETQRVEQFNGGFRLIWWIPTDYWRESFKKTAMSQAQSDAMCKSLDDFLIFAVTDVNIGPFGGVTPQPADEIISKLSAKVDQGDEMKPLDSSELSPDAKNLLAMMKPAMTNMLGQFGSGLVFVCFPAKDATGARLLDPRKPGMLQLTYGDRVYKFRLPLGSLLPPKYDPQTGEKFLGSYVYSPFTGVKLVDSPPAGKP